MIQLNGKGLTDRRFTGLALSDRIFFSGRDTIVYANEWIFGTKEGYPRTTYVIPIWTSDGVWGISDIWMTPGSGIPINKWWLSGGIPEANCLGAYQAKGASSYENSLVNLANPGTNDLTKVGDECTWSSANGWSLLGDGGNVFFDTGLVESSLQSWSYVAAFANVVEGSLLGYATQDETFTYIVPVFEGGQIGVMFASGGNVVSLGTMASGTCGIAGRYCYKNGIYAITIDVIVGTSTIPIAIGAIEFGNQLAYTRLYGDLHSAAVYNTVLTADQMLAVHNAMIAL